MTDSDNPRPRPSTFLRPRRGEGGDHTGRAGANLRRRQEELIRYEMGLLETPFIEIRPTPFQVFQETEFLADVGPFRFRIPVPKEDAPPPVYRGATAIEQMVLSPSDPGEPRRWTRLAAMVVLGFR